MHHAFVEPLETRIAPATLSIATPAPRAEGNTGSTDLLFVVTLTGAIASDVTVHYSTTDGVGATGATVADGDYTAAVGTLVFTAGGPATQEIHVPIAGDAKAENDEEFKVTLDSPTGAATLDTAVATGKILNDDDVKIAILQPLLRIAEGNAGTVNAVFTVQLQHPNSAPVTVQYATADGTAKSTGADADFTSTAGTLTFAPGETSRDITVPILSDTTLEADELFTLALSAPTHGTVETPSVQGSILNDDATLSIASRQLVEGNSGASSLVFTVTLSAAHTATVTVLYATADGTAKSSGNAADFTAAADTLTFAPGETTKTITVALAGDTTPEADENFFINLSGATNATIATVQAQGTILNDDASLTIADKTFTEGDTGTGSMEFLVTLVRASGQTQPVTVAYATAPGTATSSGPFADFTAVSGTLTFAAGESSKIITVPIPGDTIKETATKNFTVNLSAATNAAITDAQATGTLLDGSDTALGVALADVATIEGDTTGAVRTAVFRVQLSTAATSAVTFNIATRNGTAVSGVDYTALSGLRTIAVGADHLDLPVTILRDGAWEATESFFLDASGFVGATPSGAVGGALHARGTIYNDDFRTLAGGRSVQWIDVDGDLVTLRISKGTLNTLGLVSAGTVGGRQLETLDLTSQPGGFTQFAGASLSITAERQPGFAGETDGRVNVGAIIGSIILPNELQFVGVDLASVIVDGDLGRITVGDPFSTPALGRLEVFSLGALGTTTGAPNIQSDVLGPIGTVHVAGNLEGYLHVIGAEFGRIGTLKIDGALKGGALDNSGQVSVTGRISNAIVKDIIGGTGTLSGVLSGNSNTSAAIGPVKVTGSITGGSGALSGKIIAPRLGTVTVAGSVTGGSGGFSGGIGLDSLATVRDTNGVTIAQVGATLSIGKVTIGGGLLGGAGTGSGFIGTAGNLAALKIHDGITGAAGTSSGAISARGGIGPILIEGDVTGAVGGNSGLIGTQGDIASLIIKGVLRGGSGAESGEINTTAGSIGVLTIGRLPASPSAPLTDAIIGGTGEGSGQVVVTKNLASLTVLGNVAGGAVNRSGGITVNGRLGKLDLRGSLLGGDATATAALTTSGFILAADLGTAAIGGDIEAGVDNGGGLLSSGTIRTGRIASLTVHGGLLGTAAHPVVVSGIALQNIHIEGNVRFAEILAGYGVSTATGGFRGAASSADAQIGTVTIDGSVLGLNIVAGASPGADGRFGDVADGVSSGTGVVNSTKIVSQIASVIFRGAIQTNADTYGIVAQHIGSVRVGGALIPLSPGAGTDLFGVPNNTEAIGGDATKFRAVELAL